jgi:hypothetical protein
MADPRDTALSAHLAFKDVGWLSEIGTLFVNVPDDLAVGEHVLVLLVFMLLPVFGPNSDRLPSRFGHGGGVP